MKKIVSINLLLALFCSSAVLVAQVEPEFIVPDSEKFEDYFYESLKQKGIENYDLALLELEQCLTLKPNEAIVYSEMGKNYFGQKNYEKSYASFEKAAQLDSKNKWYWVGMYEASYQTKNYKQAIVSIHKLIEFSDSYREDLVSLYMITQQFDKALTLINELNDKVGKSSLREKYKASILSDGKFQNTERDNLTEQISKTPKEEANYVALIKLFYNQNEKEKASEIAFKLQKEYPGSDWAQLGLFGTSLKNDVSKAIIPMTAVFVSTIIDTKIKNIVLSEFLSAIDKNPKYGIEVEKAITYFDTDAPLNKQIGSYFYTIKQWNQSIPYLEKIVNESTDNDLATNLLLVEAYRETNQFEILAKKAAFLVEIYPAQPQFYFFAGVANNQLKRYKNAITFLELGIDYIIENTTLEAKFNLQLSESYSGLGDTKKKEFYASKANQLAKAKK
jgi:tetratricopeptide (TPR) repeat protein